MSINFFLKLRTTTLATSASSPGSIFGKPSRIVTVDPRSANVLANSHPIAPPPITATRPGKWSSISTSSLVITGPAGSKPGMVRGTLPAANTTLPPVRVLVLPSGCVTVTVRLAPSLPTPSSTVIFFDFSKPDRLFTTPSTIFCLRACATAKLTAKLTADAAPSIDCSIPNSAAWLTWRCTAAVSRNALAGMQPRFRQVPPMTPFSIKATFSPAEVA